MSKKTILITGINGFVGPHLAREFAKRGCGVIGVGFQPEAAQELSETLESYIRCDLTNQSDVAKIDFSSVDAVIHLAGLSSQGMSFDQPQRFIADNSAMIISLFEAALKQKPAQLPRFVVVSSGAVYDSGQAMPLTEDSAVVFNSPYAVSKITVEHLCSYYQRRGFKYIVARPFNHTGPGQGPGFLIPDLATQVLKAGPNGTVKIGNLKTRRDYSDVRDIVRAYADLALTDSLSHNVYNLCSGSARSGKEILEIITNKCFGEKADIKIQVNQELIRPNDPLEIYGSHQRATEDFNWRPEISLEDTIMDYLQRLNG